MMTVMTGVKTHIHIKANAHDVAASARYIKLILSEMCPTATEP